MKDKKCKTKKDWSFIQLAFLWVIIIIFTLVFILFYYPLHFLVRWKKPSVKGFVKWLKKMYIERGKPSEKWKYCQYHLPSLSSIQKLNEVREYFKSCKEIEREPVPIVAVTSRNFNQLLPLLKIPGEEKKKIEKIVKMGDEVIVCENAYTSQWKWEKRFVVVEGENKKPAKVKYLCGRFRGFPGIRFKERLRFRIFYEKYMDMRSPLLYPMVYINRDNMDELLPELDIPAEVKKEIKGLIEEGKVIVITEAAFTPEWRWKEKYLVFDKREGGISFWEMRITWFNRRKR